MKFNNLTRRAAAAGALTALAASGLVAVTSGAADAAPITNTYTCATPSFGDQEVTLDSDAPGIEGFDGVLSAGQAAPASALAVNNSFTISDAFHTGLQTYGIEDLSVSDFAGSFGNSSVPVSGISAKVSEMTQNADTTWTGIATQGLNDAFTAPSGGDHGVLAPAQFTIVAMLGATPVPVTCAVQGTPGTYATLTVVKNTSKLRATSNTPVPHGKKAVLKAKVTAPNHMPTGKVIFKDGAHKLAVKSLNAKGLAVLKTKLSKGKHKIKMIYKGDSYTTKSSGTTKVTQR